MTRRSQLEGYNHLIQSAEVSSSTDALNSNSRSFDITFATRPFPRPRRTYRTVVVRQNSVHYPLLYAHLNNDMANRAPSPRYPPPNVTCRCRLPFFFLGGKL